MTNTHMIEMSLALSRLWDVLVDLLNHLSNILMAMMLMNGDIYDNFNMDLEEEISADNYDNFVLIV